MIRREIRRGNALHCGAGRYLKKSKGERGKHVIKGASLEKTKEDHRVGQGILGKETARTAEFV